MGCCLSTTKPSKAENHHYPSVETSKTGGPTPQPPRSPPPLEEETVKEVVLSEPSVPKATTLNVKENVYVVDDKEPQVQERSFESRVLMKPAMGSAAEMKPAEEIISEVSEYSEMCSFTESLSAATAPEKRDDDGEVTQRSPARVQRKRRSSGEVTRAREKGARSPARPSVPERRGQLVSSRADHGRQINAQRRNAGPANNLRRNPVEGSVRRSRSPVTRTEVGTRQNVRHKSPGVSETGRSGGRSPARTVNDADKEEKSDEVVSPENGESLENPVVSLECFIFL